MDFYFNMEATVSHVVSALTCFQACQSGPYDSASVCVDSQVARPLSRAHMSQLLSQLLRHGAVPTCNHETSGVPQAHAKVQHMLCRIPGAQLQSKGFPHCDEWRPAAVDLH